MLKQLEKMPLSIPWEISRWLNSRKAMLLLSFICLVTVNVLWLYLTVPWGLSAVCDCGIS